MASRTRSARDGHVCQAFAGRRSARLDHELPLKYQRDPWCWEPHLGFHRSSAANCAVLLSAGAGQRLVGPDFIAPYQALRLGYGLGMGSTAGDISEFVRRFCEISGPVRFTDAEPFALFGHAVRGYEQMQDAPAQYAVRRAAFREAYRLMGDLTALLGAAWTDLLDQAAADLPVTADDAEWAAEQERAGTQPRDRAAGHTFHALRDAGHGGDSRGLAQLFVLTQPGEGRAAAWLRGVGAAIARGVAAMPAETSD